MGKVLGIDFGETRIGLAMSSADGHFVFPHQTVDNDGSDKNITVIHALCQQEKIERIVIGLPLDQYGQMGKKAASVKEWGERLARGTGIPIAYEDERYSTALAASIKKQAGWSVKKSRSTIDQTAAAMILQTYLDKHHE